MKPSVALLYKCKWSTVLISLISVVFLLFFKQGISLAEAVQGPTNWKEKEELIKDLEENWPERYQEYKQKLQPLTVQGYVLDQYEDPIRGGD